MSINIAEVLVANGCGASMVVLLFLFRIRTHESRRAGEWLYDSMLVATLIALIAETVSFLIDGKPFSGCHFLQYLSNTLSTVCTVFVGFFWCLFVDFRIYRNLKRLRRKCLALGALFGAILLLSLANLWGNGLVFRITDDNRYVRGPFNSVIIAVLFLYFVESIVTVQRSRRHGLSMPFFPVYCFVVPCMVGTIIQGIFYGLATGWLTVAMAFVFVNLQLQNFNSFVDDMSGLFNRKYLNYCLDSIQKSRARSAYGLMLDANEFKKINDVYGHSTGDRAIFEIGKILSHSAPPNAVVIRISGDEFVILMEESSAQELEALKAAIGENTRRFNETAGAPFHLSLSMGGARFDGQNIKDFFSHMDREMYAAKKEYYKTHERRKT